MRYATPCSYNTSNSPGSISTKNGPTSSPVDSSLLSGSPKLELELHWEDLELFHHYIISASATIARQPSQEEMWRVAVPQLAMQHRFLMQGIFAVSALHLAHLHPERHQELIIVAAQHQQSALQSYRSVLENVTQDNCNAVFAFSGLVVCYAFGSPQLPEGLLLTRTDKTQPIPDWLRFIRGAFSLLSSSWSWIQNGPMAPMLEPIPRNTSVLNDTDDKQLRGLQSLLDSPTLINRDEQTLDKTKLYHEALYELRRAFAESYSLENPAFCVRWASFDWPVRVSEGFIKLLSEKEPRALILLAHYCVLLKREEPCWYIDGHGQQLLSTIEAILDEDSKKWIEWPCHQIRG